jgi:signal transduction histidine kinase
VEKQAEEEKEKTTRAEDAVRERDVFLSVASHELRTPLTALQLTLERLDRMVDHDFADAPAADRIRPQSKAALRQTHRLTDLVERLLDVSRITASGLQIDPAPVDLGALVQEVVADFQEKAIKAEVEVIIRADEDARGFWDQRRLEQVVLNLLSNAEKYGEGKPIRVEVSGDGDSVRVRVVDQGIGIADRDQARIFGAFERAVPADNYGGLGLGLYITRRIVEAHGGTIELSSAYGRGTTVTVTLPRAAMHHE